MKAIALIGAVMLAGAAPATAGADVEINYPEGSLGFAAFQAGDYERAAQMIESNNSISRSDPARLINLGIAYERMGDYSKARDLYTRAFESSDGEKLILSNGEMIDSRVLARQVIARLSARIASN